MKILKKFFLYTILALSLINYVFCSTGKENIDIEKILEENNDLKSYNYQQNQEIEKLKKMYNDVLKRNSFLAQQFMQSQLEKNQLQEQVDQSYKTIQQLISDNAQLVLEVSEFKQNNLSLSRELRKRSSSMSSSTFSVIDEEIK